VTILTVRIPALGSSEAEKSGKTEAISGIPRWLEAPIQPYYSVYIYRAYGPLS